MNSYATNGKFLATALITGVIMASSFGTANAGSCDGRVAGLSSNYNFKKGTGFLAVRSGPSSRTRMKAELYNGERVELYSKRGNWYEISAHGIDGWAYAKYIRTTCDPNNP